MDSRSTSTTISTIEIQLIIENLKSNHHRASTKRNCYCVWKCFNEFLLKLDHKPKSWEDRLVLIAGFLIKEKQQSSTIRSYISTIKSVLRDDGIQINEDKYLLSSLTKACHLHNDQVQMQLPIRKGMLRVLLKNVPEVFPEQPYLSCLLKTLFSTAYFGLF